MYPLNTGSTFKIIRVLFFNSEHFDRFDDCIIENRMIEISQLHNDGIRIAYSELKNEENIKEAISQYII
jgi:hypothetical protein